MNTPKKISDMDLFSIERNLVIEALSVALVALEGFSPTMPYTPESLKRHADAIALVKRALVEVQS